MYLTVYYIIFKFIDFKFLKCFEFARICSANGLALHKKNSRKRAKVDFHKYASIVFQVCKPIIIWFQEEEKARLWKNPVVRPTRISPIKLLASTLSLHWGCQNFSITIPPFFFTTNRLQNVSFQFPIVRQIKKWATTLVLPTFQSIHCDCGY